MSCYRIVKRSLDLVGSAALVVATAPIMAITAALVANKLGRPVLFAQERIGLDGRVFTLYKFRSMREANLAQGIVADADRLTSFGRKLRSTSLDELPSLVNVLKGQMSFVGPRPLLVRYMQWYTPEQARRHEVHPGITGLAQVSGRNALGWEDRFALDVRYVEDLSFLLDLQILVRTVISVLRRQGITAAGEATMTEFRGVAVETGCF